MRFLLLSTCLTLMAQGPQPTKPAPKVGIQALPELPQSKPQAQGANPLKELIRVDLTAEEAGTPEALTSTLYALVSGPAGVKRDVDKIRSLFHLQARIMVVARHPEKGVFLRPMELEAFLSYAPPQWEKTGFFERGTGTSVQKLDGMAQVWSPYEIRLAAEGPAMYTGVNALQCGWDGKRWWITHLEFQNMPTPALLATPAEPKK